MRLLFWIGGWALAGAACVNSNLLPCGDGWCPVGYVCVPSVARCAVQLDLDRCANSEEGAECLSSDERIGACLAGICTVGACGNGVVESPEACDDGNLESGDGCRRDCAKIEVCGDAIADAGEQCDDGNASAIDTCAACRAQNWRAHAVIGEAFARGIVDVPRRLALDERGRVYVATYTQLLRISADGSVVQLKHFPVGTEGFSNGVTGIAVDGLENVYYGSENQIFRLSPEAVTSRVAGTGGNDSAPDGSAATSAALSGVGAIAVDGFGRVWFAETNEFRIRRIELDGTLKTIAGNGNFRRDNSIDTEEPALESSLPYIGGIALNRSNGDVFFVEEAAQRIRQIHNGVMKAIAGGGDAPPATGMLGTDARLEGLADLFAAPDGMVYFSANEAIWRLQANASIEKIANCTSEGCHDASVVIQNDSTVVYAVPTSHKVFRWRNNLTETLAGSGVADLASVDPNIVTDRTDVRSVAVTDDGTLFIGESLPDAPARISVIFPDGKAQRIAMLGDQTPGLAVDAAQRLLVAVPSKDGSSAIYRLESNLLRRLAGDPDASDLGDGGAALAANLGVCRSVLSDGADAFVIADGGNLRLRRVAEDGTITTIAGSGQLRTGLLTTRGATPALETDFTERLRDLTRLPSGELVFIDRSAIRCLRANGMVETLVPEADFFSSVEGNGPWAWQPRGLAATSDGRLYFGDVFGTILRVVEPNGAIHNVSKDPSGTEISTTGFPASGDGGPITEATFAGIHSMVVGPDDTIWIADTHRNGHHQVQSVSGFGRVRRLLPNGFIAPYWGWAGLKNLGTLSEARLQSPSAIAGWRIPDGSWRYLIANGEAGTVSLVTPTEVQRAIGRYPQGQATADLAYFRGYDFGSVHGVAYAPSMGRLYLSETSANRIWEVIMVGPTQRADEPQTWTMHALVNISGAPGFLDGSASTANLREPRGLWWDEASQLLYVADTGNHAIRAVSPSARVVTTVVNRAHRLGFAGDGGSAQAALLYQPSAITKCPNGDFFIADTGNHRIRRIHLGSVVANAQEVAQAQISTVLGEGTPANSGDGAPSVSFPTEAPRGLVCDDMGNVFVAATRAVRALAADRDGAVTGEQSVRTIYRAALRDDKFPENATSCLTGIASVFRNRSDGGPGSSSVLWVADECSGLLVEIALVLTNG